MELPKVLRVGIWTNNYEGKTTSYSLEVILSPQWTWRTQHQTKENYSWAFRSNRICPAGFWTCLGPITIFSFWFLFGTIMSLFYPSYHYIWKHIVCFISVVHSWREIHHRMKHYSSLIHIWFYWYLEETLDFRL